MSNESAIRREVGTLALMFTGLGSIIGSGWLFGAWRAAQLAGPGAIYAWIIGAVIILFVALTLAPCFRSPAARCATDTIRMVR
jgi:amino acid transporter